LSGNIGVRSWTCGGLKLWREIFHGCFCRPKWLWKRLEKLAFADTVCDVSREGRETVTEHLRMAGPVDKVSSVERLIAGLRQNYLAELPEKFDELESLILKLDKASSFTEAFVELYRQLHSLKGTSGTFGLTALSNICHQFEDALNLIDQNFSNINTDRIDICLRYLDLLRGTTIQIKNGTLDNAQTEQALARIRDRLLPAEFHGLYVDSSKLGARVCADALDGTGFKITAVHDGLLALERLLQEKFDFLITSKELPRLNGVALLNAVRASETENATIKAVLITSKDNVAGLFPNLFEAIIKKDGRMAASLQQVLKSALVTKAK